MLVLSRQRDETIMIGDDIEITIVDIRGDKVRLGITAPATIPVHRKEVYDVIQRENREAARVKMQDLGTLPQTPAGRSSVPPGLPRPMPKRQIEVDKAKPAEASAAIKQAITEVRQEAASQDESYLPPDPQAGHRGPQVISPPQQNDGDNHPSKLTPKHPVHKPSWAWRN